MDRRGFLNKSLGGLTLVAFLKPPCHYSPKAEIARLRALLDNCVECSVQGS